MGSLRSLMQNKSQKIGWAYSNRVYLPHVEYPISSTIENFLRCSQWNCGTAFLSICRRLGFNEFRYFIEDSSHIGVTVTKNNKFHLHLAYRSPGYLSQIGECGFRADFCVESQPETALIIREATVVNLELDLVGFMRGYE
jgi:hypothetical protein